MPKLAVFREKCLLKLFFVVVVFSPLLLCILIAHTFFMVFNEKKKTLGQDMVFFYNFVYKYRAPAVVGRS